jgi:LuxR family transcriptional regulator, maltose regulon positive regulatory protein
VEPAEGSEPVVGGSVGRAGVVLRPELFERLEGPARVTVVSAPAGSGKTVLLRSWITEAGLTQRAAFVPAGRDERDPQRFWLAALRALGQTDSGARLVQAVSAAPDLDGWALVERLLADLAVLKEPLWLVIDDVHELASSEVLRQLELLVMRAPLELRFVLATRHDVRLGLHRLRLEGELAEIRADDLTFSVAEAKLLLEGAGVALPGPALATLHERTEGWAAGLRLAALSLARHPDPGRFAEEFSGGERTVAEYLLAEVLERQSDHVRRLLLRTSVLQRVNGQLADLLTGDEGGEGVLQDLEDVGAFVVSLDPARTWFRYHQLFVQLLQLQLRRAAPDEITGLHRSAAVWFADHGFPAEAIRHALAAKDFDLGARLLVNHWPGLYLDGQAAITHELLAGFPPDLPAVDTELAAVVAADELAQGSLETAEHYLDLAERTPNSLPQARQHQVQMLLGVVRLLLARQRGNLPAVTEEARRLSARSEAPAGLGEDLRALALVSLGTTEFWAGRFEDTNRHLGEGVALAGRIGRPYLEFTGLAYQANTEIYESFTRSAERAREAIGLAERHGWTDDPATGVACVLLGATLAWQGRPEEAEHWLQRAERTLRAEAEPAAVVALHYVRGLLELARRQDADALAEFLATEPLAQRLAAPHYLLPATRSLLVHLLVRLGETERAEQVLAGLSEQDRERGEIRMGQAALRLAQGDRRGAHATLAPVLDGSAPMAHHGTTMAHAFILEAMTFDTFGDSGAAECALERALDLAEPNGVVLPFLILNPAPELLERKARLGTAHAALIAEILSLLRGTRPAPPSAGPRAPLEPLSDSELRVLRYLPTRLTGPEIARELYVSQNTVKTHLRSVYAKLGTHRRIEAIERARALGLIAPSGGGRTISATPEP